MMSPPLNVIQCAKVYQPDRQCVEIHHRRLRSRDCGRACWMDEGAHSNLLQPRHSGRGKTLFYEFYQADQLVPGLGLAFSKAHQTARRSDMVESIAGETHIHGFSWSRT